MKITALKSKLAVAAPLALVGVFGVSHMVVAQPDAPAAGGKGNKGRRAKGGLPPKMREKIETALGKPLTAEQTTQLNVAAREQKKAVAEAQEKFEAEVVRVTGLPADKVSELKKKTPKAAANN